MADTLHATPAATSIASDPSTVSWSAVIAGGITAAALTLVLVAFGSAVGFSSVSPWSNAGVSSGTFGIGAGLYLVVMAMLASTVGGYIAGRMRSRWAGLRTHERQFRDTAHGFLAWALATVIGAAVLGATATYLAGGAAQGAAAGPAAAQSPANPAAYYADMLLRPAANGHAPAAGNNFAVAREVQIVFTHDLGLKAEWPAADRAYLAQLVAARTGLSQGDAEKRVTDVVTAAKADADRARKAAASLSIWLALSMLVGAFCASVAAIEGGQLRDERWIGVFFTRGYHAQDELWEATMGYILLWLIGIPIPLLLIIALIAH